MFSLSLFSLSNSILYAVVDSDMNIVESNQNFDHLFDREGEESNINSLFTHRNLEFNVLSENYEFVDNGMTVKINQQVLENKIILVGELYYADENYVYKEIAKQNNEIQNLNRELHKKNKEIEKVVKELNRTRLKLIQEGRLMGLLRIAGGVAHEINNPLSFVTGNIRYIEEAFSRMAKEGMITYYEDEMDGLTQEEYKEVTEEIFEGLDRIKDIVESFRAYTNVDRYEKTCECNLGDCLGLIIQNLPSTVKGNTSIDSSFQEDINSFLDLSLFNDAMTHLLMNALESFASEGENKVWVRLIQLENKIQIEIEDNGKGIEEKDKAYIFDPFFTTKDIGKGEGIGLSLCYDYFVNTLKGTIEIESEFSKGTKVVVEFVEPEGN